jgi:hypothetical protein
MPSRPAHTTRTTYPISSSAQHARYSHLHHSHHTDHPHHLLRMNVATTRFYAGGCHIHPVALLREGGAGDA